MLQKLLVGAIVIMIFLAMCVLHMNRQLEKQEMVTKAQTQVINSLYDNTKLVETINEERRAFEQRLDDERKGLYNEMRRVLRNDKKAAAWADTPIPDTVMRLRKADGTRAGAVAPSQR